jgi:hypothetical protein
MRGDIRHSRRMSGVTFLLKIAVFPPKKLLILLCYMQATVLALHEESTLGEGFRATLFI